MKKLEYEQEWKRAGYPKGMGSASVVPPPSHEFVRAYHLTSAEHGISSISLRRLKVARFSEVNDPFELLALNFHEPRMRRLVRRFKDSHNSTTGLLCFSANWTDPVLWSHYATRHKGICLGFDLRRANEVQTVLYEQKRLRMKLGPNEDPRSIPKDLQDRLLRTKSSRWEYEQELRKFIDLSKAQKEQGLYFWSFDNDLRLKEVILGQQNDLPLLAVRRLVAATNSSAVVFKARLAFRSFDIMRDGRYLPEKPSHAT